MNRYFSSFLIALFLNISVVSIFFNFLPTIYKPGKKISLNNIKIVYFKEQKQQDFTKSIKKEQNKKITNKKIKSFKKKIVKKAVKPKKKKPKIVKSNKTKPKKHKLKAKKHTKKQKSIKKKSNKSVKKSFSNSNFLYQLVKRINSNKSYPTIAKQRGLSANVKASFTILPNGNVTNISIDGSRIFYKSTYDAIKKSFPIDVKSAPFSLPKRVTIRLKYTI